MGRSAFTLAAGRARIVGTLLAVLAAGLVAAADGPATRESGPSTQPTYKLLDRRGDPPDNPWAADKNPAYRAHFNAKGTRLLTATADEVRVWTVPAMRPATKPLAVKPHVDAADLSPDGTLVLTADGDGWLRVRRVGAAEPLWGRRHEGGWEWAAFNPDGRSVLAVERGGRTVRLLDPATGKETLTITDETAEAGIEAAVSADGSRLMTSSLGPTRVWSTATGKPLARGRGFGSIFAIGPTGDRFAGQAQAGEVTAYNAAGGGKELATTAFAYRNDSQVAN